MLANEIPLPLLWILLGMGHDDHLLLMVRGPAVGLVWPGHSNMDGVMGEIRRTLSALRIEPK